jgi:hypothetical protein
MTPIKALTSRQRRKNQKGFSQIVIVKKQIKNNPPHTLNDIKKKKRDSRTKIK